LGGIAFFSLIVMAILFVARNTSRPRTPTIPNVPIHASLNEWSKTQVGDETVFAREFVLGNESKFLLETASAEISIEGWDQPKAEIKVIQRGGSADERERPRVDASMDRGNLAVRAPGSGRVRMEFAVKIPRRLAEVQVKTQSSEVSLSGITAPVVVNTSSGAVALSTINGAVSVNTQSGAIELREITGPVSIDTQSGDISLEDVSGETKASSISGDVSLVFEDAKLERAIRLNTKSGDIEIELGPDPNGDLKADTLSGQIDVDDEVSVDVRKNVVGQQASGQFGRGGQPVSMSTISGRIKISK
jgi:DUF4097 and DUF4098 domain-containing protein YvlB